MALLFIDRAIEYDQAGSLNLSYAVFRAEIWQSLGNDGPLHALILYNQAIDLAEAGRLPEAETRYLEAFRLDPGFLWSLNNLSWKLATTPLSQFLNGPRSLQYATIACRQSHGTYWAFVSTLAAAHARCGLFTRAVACQRRAIAMAPASEQLLLADQLALYERSKPYTAVLDMPVAGNPPDRSAGSTLQ